MGNVPFYLTSLGITAFFVFLISHLAATVPNFWPLLVVILVLLTCAGIGFRILAERARRNKPR